MEMHGIFATEQIVLMMQSGPGGFMGYGDLWGFIFTWFIYNKSMLGVLLSTMFTNTKHISHVLHQQNRQYAWNGTVP